MARIQTTIRIDHKTNADREKFETELDKAIKKLGYSTRAEWLRDMKRNSVERALNN